MGRRQVYNPLTGKFDLIQDEDYGGDIVTDCSGNIVNAGDGTMPGTTCDLFNLIVMRCNE